MADRKSEQARGFVPDPPVMAPRPERPSISLGHDAADSAIWESFMDNLIVRNTTQARLYSFMPNPDAAKGKTVVILPGGGHQMVSIEHEGFKAAARLADLGYGAYVLAYRTRPTPVDPDAFFAEMGAQFRKLGTQPPPENPSAVEDLAAALTYLGTEGATQISVLGFSAGARTVLRYLEAPLDAPTLADIALIYPPMTPVDVLRSDGRMFVAAAADDPLVKASGIRLISGLLDMGKTVEFHLFQNGGHGFGMAKTGATADGWCDSYLAWLDKGRTGAA